MPTVLVTGASRGIGRAIVDHLAASGWDVMAGVRTEQDATAVTRTNPERISAVLLDITDTGHISALVDSLPERLDAVVNNAGMVVAGPIETVTPDDWRKQFEVNVIGQLAVTQAVLPRLRLSKGRVVFVSSVNGRLAVPLLGAYSASKFALEAAADTLRMELKAWGIDVVIIEPAQTDTDMWGTSDTLVTDTEAAMSSDARALYDRHITGLKKSLPIARKLAGPPGRVAAVVEEALTARRPRARYVVGLGPKLQTAVMTKLPAAVRDRVMRAVSRQPGRF